MTKSNIGPTAPALACRLAEEAGRPRLQWLGECDATADELCRPRRVKLLSPTANAQADGACGSLAIRHLGA
jgi:hypothetical protein